MKILVLLMFFTSEIYSQTFNIYGYVKDTEGRPLQGVNVLINSTNTGDATNFLGEYKIEGLKPGEVTITFSSVGYEQLTRKFIIERNIEMNITLEQRVLTTDQVIVSAGKYKQKLSELPVSAAVIQGKDIMKHNYDNLRDALRYVSGLNFIGNQLSIRGSSGFARGVGARVLMTVEGFPFYTADAGEVKWETVPVNQIESIEIIKGASSSLYGSTAVGGIINVITREAVQPSTQINTFVGAYDKPYYDSWDWSNSYRMMNGQSISHSNVFGKFNITASFTRREDEGYRRNDFNKRYIGYLKTGYKLDDKNSFNLLFNTLHQYSGNFNYWKNSRHALEPPDNDLGTTITSGRYMLGLISKNKLSSNLDLLSRLSYYKTKWSDETESKNDSDADQYRAEVQSDYRLSEKFLLISGAEISYNTVISNLFGNPDAAGTGIYMQGDYTFDFPLGITGGIRYDYSNTNGEIKESAVSPRLGLNYRLNQNLTLRAMAGSGFRAPSLAERFTSTSISGVIVKPNPKLEAESNITLETGLMLSYDYLNIDAAIFRNEFYDMIEFAVNMNDGSATFDNLVRARIQGFELNFMIRILDNLILNSGYTFADTRDLNKGAALKYRHSHILSSSVSYSNSGFETGINFRYLSRFKEIDADLVRFGIISEGDNYGNIYVVDLNAGYNFVYTGFPLRAYINVKNLFNYYYVELIGNVGPLRNIALNLELFL